MKSLALLCVFLAARAAIVPGQDLHWSAGTILALLAQDAAFILAFALLERIPRSRTVTAWLYWLIVVYVAVNVPVARMFATPLTLPMLRATRGTLADSIGHHVDFANVAGISLVLAVALLAPNILRRWAVHPGPRFLTILTIVCLGGFWASARVDVGGLQRNCVAALVLSGQQQVVPLARHDEWRKSSAAESSALAAWQGAAHRRNVVLVLLESTGARHLKLYGAATDPTPHLTHLAQTGIVFEHAYAAYPESIKGLFSVLASRYPAIETTSKLYRHIGRPGLAEVLRKNGYRTALFHSGRFMYLGMDDVVHDRGFDLALDAGDIGGQHESSFGVEEPATVERILEWLAHVGPGEPFFLTYLPTAGHHPYFTPSTEPSSEDASDRERYLQALRYGDEALGQLIAGMNRLGRFDDTLFVFVGDHGEAFGEHPGNFGHTLHIYEENVRVPLIMVAPGLMHTQTRVPHLASVIDIAPTVLDLLGLEIPSSYQGLSLLDHRPAAVLFYTDYASRLVGLREDRWKFIYEFESGRSQLFDLQSDPNEITNLRSAFPDKARAFASHVQSWSAAQKAFVLQQSAPARSSHRPLPGPLAGVP